MEVLAVLPAAVVAALVVVQLTRFRGVAQQDYRPSLAWIRAGTYVAFCWFVSIASGTFDRIVSQAPVDAAQRGDPRWVAWTVVSVGTILLCYWVIWARWTLHFDRRRAPGWQILFAVLWGSGSGQLFVSIHDGFDRAFASTWAVWLASYVAISVWQGAFQDLYWDVYVSPEHDTPWSITRKVIFSHVPNVTVTLTYLVLFGNRLIFVALQTLALIAASVFMRMPPAGETRPTLAPATGPAFGPLVRAIGYQTDDPDPYRTQRNRPREAT